MGKGPKVRCSLSDIGCLGTIKPCEEPPINVLDLLFDTSINSFTSNIQSLLSKIQFYIPYHCQSLQ